MAQVNPQLSQIITLLEAQATANYDLYTLLDIRTGDQNALLTSIDTKLSDIKTGIDAIALSTVDLSTDFDQLLIDTNAISTLLDAISGTSDVINSNIALNASTLLGQLDIINTNQAANALFLKEAICGDCEATPPPIDGAGAICRTTSGGYSGTGSVGTDSIAWFIGPGVTGQIGDTARFRLNSVTAGLQSAILYDGDPATGATAYPLALNGEYVEFVITEKPAVLSIVRLGSGPFNWNYTMCVIPQPA